MEFQICEANYEGVCVIRLEGRWNLGNGNRAFDDLFNRRVNENNRLFVIDISKVVLLDSTALGSLFMVPGRLSQRVSEFFIVLPSSDRARQPLAITGVMKSFPWFCATLDEALSKILRRPVECIEPRLEFEERFPTDKGKDSRDRNQPLESQLSKINIFLASSEELRKDRDEFEIYFRQLNDELTRHNRYLVILRWENFLDAMSETRLQDEYNKAIGECDIFVSLFSTRTGKFTEEEFDTAHQCFKKSGKPLIYTFFKNTTINVNDICESDLLSLIRFKQRLKDLGHFYTSFDSTEDLKLRFRTQLDKLLGGPLG